MIDTKRLAVFRTATLLGVWSVRVKSTGERNWCVLLTYALRILVLTPTVIMSMSNTVCCTRTAC